MNHAIATMPAVTLLPGVTGDEDTGLSNYEGWAKNEVRLLYREHGDWQQVTAVLSPHLALSRAAWWHVANGRKITRAKIDALRAHRGMPPLPVYVQVQPCPDCGQAHLAPRCHGQPVAAVVVLAPGERVTAEPERQPSRTHKRRPVHRPCIASDAKWRAYLAWSQAWDAEHATS